MGMTRLERDRRLLADKLQRERRQQVTDSLRLIRDRRDGLDRRNNTQRLRDNRAVGSWMTAFDTARMG